MATRLQPRYCVSLNASSSLSEESGQSGNLTSFQVIVQNGLWCSRMLLIEYNARKQWVIRCGGALSLMFKRKRVLSASMRTSRSRPVSLIAFSPNECDSYATTGYIPPNSVSHSSYPIWLVINITLNVVWHVETHSRLFECYHPTGVKSRDICLQHSHL